MGSALPNSPGTTAFHNSITIALNAATITMKNNGRNKNFAR